MAENDLVETSAHLGARNKDGKHVWSNHEAWQGRVFHLGGGRNYTDGNGETKFAPSFKDACGLGYADGICGVNCRHSYYPYFEGTKQTFSQLDENEIEVDGKKMSQYEAEQKQRYYERGVRYWKRHADVLAAAGEDNTQARMKVREWQGKAKDWTDKTGLRRDYAREAIGTASGRQVYGLKPKTENNITITVADKDKAIDKLSDTIKTKKLEFVFGKNYDKIGTLENYDKLSPKEKEKEVCAYVVRNGILSEREHIVVTDTKGNIIKTAEGAQDRASVTVQNTKPKSLEITHCHLSDNNLSLVDIVELNKNKVFGKIRAVGIQDANVYSLKIPLNKELSEKDINNWFKVFDKEGKAKYNELLAKGKINKHKYETLVDNYIMESFAKKFKWEYNKEQLKWN